MGWGEGENACEWGGGGVACGCRRGQAETRELDSCRVSHGGRCGEFRKLFRPRKWPTFRRGHIGQERLIPAQAEVLLTQVPFERRVKCHKILNNLAPGLSMGQHLFGQRTGWPRSRLLAGCLIGLLDHHAAPLATSSALSTCRTTRSAAWKSSKPSGSTN